MFVGYIRASYIVADTDRRALVKLGELESCLMGARVVVKRSDVSALIYDRYGGESLVLHSS